MEYDLHKDLDGLGERLNLEVNERIRCSADKGARVAHLEQWTKDHETAIEDIKRQQGVMAVSIVEMGNTVVSKLSGRLALMGAVMTAVLGGLMWLARA